MSSNLEIPPGFDEAPKEQRIAFVQELWDRIAQDPERVPVPVEHQRILEERLKEYRANPKPGRQWSEVRDQLLTKLRRA
jgi:putative addiction module component (TIGR02574 family)